MSCIVSSDRKSKLPVMAAISKMYFIRSEKNLIESKVGWMCQSRWKCISAQADQDLRFPQKEVDDPMYTILINGEGDP